MEHAADVHVELVKLVDGLSRAHIPQHAVIQHQVVCWVEGGTVPLVVVGQRRVVQSQSLLTRLDVVDLQHTTRMMWKNISVNINVESPLMCLNASY